MSKKPSDPARQNDGSASTSTHINMSRIIMASENYQEIPRESQELQQESQSQLPEESHLRLELFRQQESQQERQQERQQAQEGARR